MNAKTDYKTTEIGDVPREWQVIAIGKIAREVKLKNDSNKNLVVFAVTKHSGLVPSLEYFKKRVYSQDLSKYKVVKREQFAYSPIHLNEGAIGILETENEGLVSPLHVVFEFLPEANPYFFKYLLKSYRFLSIYFSLPQGSVERRGSILFNDFSKIYVQLPPLKEQNKIVSIISTVDDAINKTDKMVQRTQELKRGLMQHLLTRGIGHTRFKQTQIGEIPEEWKAKQLKEVVKFIKSGISREFSSQDIGYPVIRSTNIQDNRLNLRELKYWHLKDPQNVDLKNYIVEDGDILVNFINSIDQMGKCCIFRTQKRDFIYTTNILRVKLDQTMLLHDYFHYFVQTGIYKSQIYRISKLAVQQASFTHTDFQKIEISIPPIEEQKKIVSILTELDEKIEKEKQRRKELQRLKKGLMQDLLTGRVRVKVS